MNLEKIYIQQIRKINIHNPDLGVDFDIDILANENGGAEITLEPKKYQFGDGQERQLFINAKLTINLAQADHSQTLDILKQVKNQLNTKIAIIVKIISDVEDERWYFDKAMVSGYSVKRGFGDELHILTIQVSNAVLKEENFCIFGYNDYDIKVKYDKIVVNSSYYPVNVYERSKNYYYNNKVWFIAQVNVSGVQTNYMWYYDLLTKTYSAKKDLLAPGVSGSDNHHIAPIMLSDDGYILYAYDNVSTSHNRGIIVKRSTSPEDYNNFATVFDGYAQGFFMGYPNLFKFPNGKIMLLWRGEPGVGSDYHNCGMFSSDGGQTWGSPFKIVDEITGIVGITDPINYYIVSGSNNKYLGMMVIVRNGSAGKNKRIYYYQTEDGETWYNSERTFSKNVVTNGSITPAESETYFLVDGSIDTTNNDYFSPIAVAIDDDGTPFLLYQILYYENGNYDNRHAIFVHYKNGIKTQKDITNFFMIDGILTGFTSALLARKSGYVDIFISPKGKSGYPFFYQIRSYDYGEKWYQYRNDIIPESEQYAGIGYKSICMNLLDSNTKLGFVQFVLNDGSYKQLGILKLERKK